MLLTVTPSSTADKDAAANCHGSLFMRGGELLLPAAPPNEYIYLSDFYAQIAIYADAIYSLGQIKQ